MTDPVIKFDADDPAHVRIMRRINQRIRCPHGYGFAHDRRPGDGARPEVLDEEVSAEDKGRITPGGGGL